MKTAFDLQNYIEDIELNGLKGRMINVPARDKSAKNVNILLFHGHHSSLERMGGVAELLSDFGNFCLPDMPGFGGMQPLYKIGMKPTIDNLADYMAAFIKLQYGSRKKFLVVGYSFGFLVLVRMLQKYPDIQKQVIDVIGVASFVKNDAFMFSHTRKALYRLLASVVGTRVMSFISRELFMRKWFIGSFYTGTRNAKSKFANVSKEERKRIIDFEVNLWRCNDVRTRCFTVLEMFNVNLVDHTDKISKSVISITVDDDHYFNNKVVEQHLNIVFDKVRQYAADVETHGMSTVASADDARPYFPKALMSHMRSLR